MVLKPSNHPVNNQHTGREIAKAILSDKVGPEMAQEIMDSFEGGKVPLGILQRGHLRHVMDIVDKHTATGLAEQRAIDAFRKEMQWKLTENFGDRVLEHCQTMEAAGHSPLDIVTNISRKFPAELGYTTPQQDGNSFQARLPQGAWVVYDSVSGQWDVRNDPLF